MTQQNEPNEVSGGGYARGGHEIVPGTDEAIRHAHFLEMIELHIEHFPPWLRLMWDAEP